MFTMLFFVAGCGSSKLATPAPAFTPGAGTYTTAQNVTVSDSSQNAALYCTNDGSTPTASSPQCANPIQISKTQTLKAIAIAPGMSPSSVATAAFTVGTSAPLPVVTAATPAGGASTGGTTVTITGNNFTGATAVNFGTVPATAVTVTSATSITATSPAGSGSVHVTVVTPAGTSATSTADLFTYLPVPAIAGISPTSGMVGAPVTIAGTSFGDTQGTSTVTFNGVNATSVTSWSSTSIVAVVPAGATTGNVVVTANGLVSNGVPFTVTYPTPTIALLSPASGQVGSSVAITGTNFGTAYGSVTFGNIPAAITSYVDQAIVVTVPSGLSPGGVTVAVTTAASAGSLQATANFTVTSSAGPAISSITPPSGAPGSSVTINGSGFGPAPGSVSFGGTQQTTFAGGDWSDSAINTTVPAGLATGKVNVMVTTASGQTASTTFMVTSATQTISGVVVSGPASGGTPINALVQLYAAGITGYGAGTPNSAGPQKQGSAVQTDAKTGAFSVTVDCSTVPAPGDQLYLVATGAQPQVVLMTALGSCGSIGASFPSVSGGPSGVTVNEATTIASAYALSGFAAVNSGGGIDIGAPATKGTNAPNCDATHNWQSTGRETCNYIGLKNAFATVQNLVDIPSGTALSITPYYAKNPGSGEGYNISYAPQARVNSLADILAGCANPTTGSTANCKALFTPATVGSAATPADTLQAALSIAQNPGNNAGMIAGLLTAGPFQPTISSSDATALTDWALALVYEGAGFASNLISVTGVNSQLVANGLAIDQQGNIWIPVANSTQESAMPGQTGVPGGTDGLVAVFSNQGVPLSPSATPASSKSGYSEGGYKASGSIVNPQSIAIDQNGYAWIGNLPSAAGSTTGSVAVLDAGGNVQFGSSFSNALLFLPSLSGMSVDANNNVWVSSNVANGLCGIQSRPNGGSILQLSAAGGSVSATGTVADYFKDNSSCPTFLTIDQNGNMWTYDAGNSQAKDSLFAQALDLFSTTDGSLAGGPYFNDTVQPPNIAMDSSANAWYSGDSFVNFLPGLAQMANLSGFIGNGRGSGVSAGADPLVFVPPALSSNFSNPLPSTVALDGNSNAWIVGTGTTPQFLSFQGLYQVNNADTEVLSPSNGFAGYDMSSSGLGPIQPQITSPYYFTAVDNSGNVWVANTNFTDPSGNSGSGALSEFVGIAAPVPTPLAVGLAGSSLGTRP